MANLLPRSALGALLALLLAAAPALAGTKLALVLGNSRYQNVPELENPANDAQDVARALRTLGFDVIEQRDASRDTMVKAVHDFAERLRGADIALFFYAGHGLQMNGENYLLPVDARIQNASDVRFNTINLNDIQQEMEGTERTNIIILDACRNNPFADRLAQSGRAIAGRGLVRLDAASQGSLIVFSTQPNNIALDGNGRNSPFTAALLRNVASPGLEVRQMISRVRGDVLAATDRKQTPWDSSSLVGDVYLAGRPDDPGIPLSPAPATPAPVIAAAAQAPPPTTSPPATPSPAVSDTAAECDRIAGRHTPTLSPVAVVEKATPDWPRGLAACEASVQAHPGDLRFVYQRGRAEAALKNFIGAQRDFRTVLDAGYTDATVDLGILYARGQGVVQSFGTAIELFTRGAAAGNSQALANLAALYGNGQGVPKDDAKALDYAERSVATGNPFGLKIMAAHYFNGAGVPKSFPMAAQYLQQSADLGDGQSMKFLANMYEGGYLGPPDPQKASELRLRAQRLDPDSPDPLPPHLPMLRQASAASRPINPVPVQPRRPAVPQSYGGQSYGNQSYNPAWQAAPGDTSCCPNNQLICPTPRHFCGH